MHVECLQWSVLLEARIVTDRVIKTLSTLNWIALIVATTASAPLRAEPLMPRASESAGTARQVAADATLRDVMFLDRQHGWVVGEHGTILHTADGGQHWHAQPSATEAGLRGVSFVNRQLGWAVGGTTKPHLWMSQAVVLRTHDGGQTWQPQLALIPALERVKFFDADQGVAWGRGSGGDPLGVFASDDGGRNWRSFAVGPASAWTGGDFPDRRGGVVVGPHGQCARLAHGDAMPVALDARLELRSVRLAADGTGWAVGTRGAILRTTDHGESWQDLAVMPEDLRAAITWHTVATHDKQVWIAGSPGTVILHSPDGGQSWQGHATGHRTPLHQLYFVDDSHGWGVGDLGTILHTTDGGQTWHVQRRIGERAAVLVLLSSAEQLPLAALAKLSGDGYRTAVHLFETTADDDPTQRARITEALLQLGCNSVTFTSHGDVADDLLAEVARQIRIWKPAVVIGPDEAHDSSIDEQISQAVLEVANQSPHDDRFAHYTEQLALPSWRISRVFSVARGENRGTHRVEHTAAVPQSGQTLAEVASAARSLFAPRVHLPIATDEFHLKANLAGEPTAAVDDLAAGLGIVHDSDSRRPQAGALPFDAQLERRLAEKRRNLANIFRYAEGNPALLAQVGQMTSDLDESAAAALLYELATQFRLAHQFQLAADTLNLLARRFPNEPLADQALTWLVQFYASGETAHVYRTISEPPGLSSEPPGLSRRDHQGDKPPGSRRDETGVVPTSALSEESSITSNHRFAHAVELVEHIARTRPLLYSEPQIRVPWARAQGRLARAERQAHAWGDADSTPTSPTLDASAFGSNEGAKRYLEALSIRYPGEAWQECGAVERWLAEPERPQPNKPRIDCRFTVDRPTLDGRLDEPLWGSATVLATKSASQTPPTEFHLAYDEQYLYIAIRCAKLDGFDGSADDRARTYDADLTAYDRVRLLVDVDRDYTTWFSLTVDQRGWTNDACWGDASWNPKWFVAAASDGDHWTVEAAIPWSELTATPPTTGDAWAVACERVLPGAVHKERVSPQDFSVLLLK